MATESTKELKKRVNSKNKKTNNSRSGSSSNKKKNYKKKGNYKGKNNNYKKKSTNKKPVEKKVTKKVEPKVEVKEEVKEEKPLVEIKGIEKVEPVIEEFLPTKDLSMTVPTTYLNQVKEKIEEVLEKNAGSSITIVEPKIRVDNIVIVNDDKKEEKETKEEVKEITQEELDELIKPHKEEEEVYVDYELSKKIIIILLMALLVLSVGTIVLFMNLNVIDKSRDLVTMKTNLDVTYEIGEVNDTKKVIITINAKSNAGLKRIILPSGKVTYLDGKEQTIEYTVSKNGSYIFSISDKDNNVNQINVNVDKFN